MRTCEEYEALISAFIDGALEDGDRKELMEQFPPELRENLFDSRELTEIKGKEDTEPDGFCKL